MAVVTVYIGRVAADEGAPEGDFGEAAAGEMRACVFNSTTQHLWAHFFKARMGRNTGVSPAGRYGCYLANANKEPDDRLGYSGQWSASTSMTAWDGGAIVGSGVAFSDHGPVNSSIPISSGSRIALALLPTGASLGFGMRQAAFVTADEERFFDRSGLGLPPPDPFGSFSAAIHGHITIVLICDANEEPRVVVNRTPSGTISTTTPVMEGDFRDRNGAWGPGNDGADRGDRMSQFQIQVRRQSDGVTFWNPAPFNAGPVQQAANRFSKGYEGTALVAGTTYEWRTRTSDYFGAWGEWSDWLAFTPAAAGSVTLAGNPTGKIEETSPDFAFTWNHASGLSTNAVEVRVKQGGIVARTSATITKTVTAGNSGTITWAEIQTATTPDWADLGWGVAYTYEVRGRDTNNVWSAWSAGRSFNTNASPGVPTSLTPANSSVHTTRPLLSCAATDADADDQGASLTVKARIKDNAGAVLQTRTMTWNAATQRYEYQTLAADLASVATYKWDAYSFDGTLYSGAVTVEANATKSDEAIFVYAAGPTPTLDEPDAGETLTTSAPTVQWTVTSQDEYRVRVYAAGTTTAVIDTGWIVNSVLRQHTLTSGILTNGTTYDVEIGVKASTLEGFATSTNVLLQYTPPAAIPGFAVEAVAIGTDPWPTTFRGSWDQTGEGAGDFLKYVLYRSDIPDRPYLEFTSPSETAFYDFTPQSGVEYTFTLSQVALRDDVAEVASDPVQAQASVTLPGVVVQSATDPQQFRAVITSWQERSVTPAGEEALYLTWAGGAPVSFRGRTKYRTIAIRAMLIDDAAASALQRQAEWEAVEAWGGVVLYRDTRGRKLFGKLPPNTLVIHDTVGQRADVDVTVREEDWTEGVT